MAVSPIEEVTKKCGQRTVFRALKNSLKIYNEMKEAAVVPTKTTLLLPVLFESVDDFLGMMDAEQRKNLSGVMLFGGSEDSSLAARFDVVRSLRQSMGENFILGLHENAKPCKCSLFLRFLI